MSFAKLLYPPLEKDQTTHGSFMGQSDVLASCEASFSSTLYRKKFLRKPQNDSELGQSPYRIPSLHTWSVFFSHLLNQDLKAASQDLLFWQTILISQKEIIQDRHSIWYHYLSFFMACDTTFIGTVWILMYIPTWKCQPLPFHQHPSSAHFFATSNIKNSWLSMYLSKHSTNKWYYMAEWSDSRSAV